MRLFSLLILPIALAALTGCARPNGHTLGQTVAFSPLTVIRDLKPSSSPVTIRGTMTEKCPISGCWFKVKDSSGILLVDTKTAGFVVADVPTGSQVTVSGTFEATPECRINALGIRY